LSRGKREGVLAGITQPAKQKPVSELRILKSDPAAARAQSAETKARDAKVFRV
jgi:hypothetical protein